MSSANGKGSRHPDWVIAQDNGRTLVGARVTLNPIVGSPLNVPTRLSPVFALGIKAHQVGPSQMKFKHIAEPILMLSSWDSWDLSSSASVKPLYELDEADQQLIMAAAAKGAEMFQQLRAAKAGIALAPAGTRLPPPQSADAADESPVDAVIAFPGKRGTADMVRRGRNAGVAIIEDSRPSPGDGR